MNRLFSAGSPTAELNGERILTTAATGTANLNPSSLPSNLFYQLTFNPSLPKSAPQPLTLANNLRHSHLATSCYYRPFFPPMLSKEIFFYLRTELEFYRVKYGIHRGGQSEDRWVQRFTTCFRVDEGAEFNIEGELVPATREDGGEWRDWWREWGIGSGLEYQRRPRPMPECLDLLRRLLEQHTPGPAFNFVVVDYFASASDCMPWHCEDDHKAPLAPDSAVACLALQATQRLTLRRTTHKQQPPGAEEEGLDFTLGNGYVVVLHGEVLREWLRMVRPAAWERNGAVEEGELESVTEEERNGGMIVTFRRLRSQNGTEHFYRWNVGDGEGVHRWDAKVGKMSKVGGGEEKREEEVGEGAEEEEEEGQSGSGK